MKVRITKKLFLFAALLILSSSVVTYALTTLFTQTFPSQTFTAETLVQGSDCSGGNLHVDSATQIANIFLGKGATIFYDCSDSDQAFSTQGTTSDTITATPTITGLPAGWTLKLGVVSYPILTNPCSGALTLTSGSPVVLTGGTDYGYCFSTNSATSFSSFTITWSQ